MQPQRETVLAVSESQRGSSPFALLDRAGWTSLERKLPLVMVLLLAVLLAVSLAVTYSVLRRSVELSARDRLASAVTRVASSAGQALQRRAADVNAVAATPELRALLSSGASASNAEIEAARRVLASLSPSGARGASEVWSAAGELILHDGPASLPAITPNNPAPDSTLHSLYADGENVYAWTVAPVPGGRDGPLGHVASRIRFGGAPGAAEDMRAMTGEPVTIYARNASGDLWVRQPGTLESAPDRRAVEGGLLTHVRPGIGRTIVAEATVPGTSWVAVVEAPLRSVVARANGTIYSLALASIALMILGTLIAWSLSVRITRPIVSLTHAAEAIAAGEYGRRVDVVDSDEIGRLAASFNQMAAQLESSRQELMELVQEALDARLESERSRGVTEQARQQAERASRAKGDFLAVMSHELRTPLNAIGGYAQLLELGVHGPVNAAQLNAVQRIARNQAHLLTLINDVLNYAKLDAGKVQYAITDVPVGGLFDDLEPLIAPQVLANELHYQQYPPDPALTVRADRDKLHQILLNLLSNALKFTPRRGRVTLSCSTTYETVSVHVRDTGIGIAPDRLETIFEPFYQGDRALSNPADGVGLGLAISRDLARGMNGDLAVWSSVGQGSVFTVTLPRDAG